MLRIALATAALMLATAAQAQTTTTTETRTCKNNFMGGGTTCTTTTQQGSGSPGAGTAMRLSRQELADQATRIAKWEEACQPKLAYDRYGVARYTYARPDCEMGLVDGQ